MNVQMGLFCPHADLRTTAIDPRTLSARNDPQTSQEAATEAVESGLITRQGLQVLAALKEHGPCTGSELEQRDSGNKELESRG
ncbi:MAG: hypothetical protein KGL39_34580 [Patescibacteria group bacterium]|nr:hypothetical protein [Patescibacteria group bacterium]